MDFCLNENCSVPGVFGIQFALVNKSFVHLEFANVKVKRWTMNVNVNMNMNIGQVAMAMRGEPPLNEINFQYENANGF